MDQGKVANPKRPRWGFMQRDFEMPIAVVHGKVRGNGGARTAQAGRQPLHRRKGSRWNIAGAVVPATPAHRQQVPQPDPKTAHRAPGYNFKAVPARFLVGLGLRWQGQGTEQFHFS